MTNHLRSVFLILVAGMLIFTATSFGQSLDDLLEKTPGAGTPTTINPPTSGQSPAITGSPAAPDSAATPGTSGASPIPAAGSPEGLWGIFQQILTRLGLLPGGAPINLPLPEGMDTGSGQVPPTGTTTTTSTKTATTTTTTGGSTPGTGPGTTTEERPTPAEIALEQWKGGALSPEKFFNLLGPVAREVFARTGVPASVTLAQAAVETGYGASSIGNARNLFGIKGTGPAGTTLVSTREHINGEDIIIKDKFRKYHTWTESIEDHGKFLLQKRYAKCMENKDNPDQFARELQKAGYATAPNYASVLIKRMKQYDLYKWDAL